MRTIETGNFSIKKIESRLRSLITAIGCLIAFFSALNVASQTFPTSCTSKDLTLLKASLPAPAGNRCLCSGDRSLVLGIHNGTSSTRTSFAFWGTMNVYDATGAQVGNPHSIFACAGPIPPSGDYFLTATTLIIDGETVPNNSITGFPTITVSCGESLYIVNMHLAWTAATAGATCASLYASPSTINPKCGTQDSIRVDLGVNGDLVAGAATCTTGGTVKVTPFGGIAPYEVSIDGGTTYTAVPTNPGYYTFTNVPAGSVSVIIRDNTNAAVSARCTVTKNTSVGTSTPPTAQAAGDLITCSNPNGSLSGTGSSTGSNISYLWTGPATIANSSAISTTTTSSGTYTLKVTNSDNGCTATATASVSVNTTAPNASFGSDGTITCSHPNATLTATSPVSGFTYLWSGPGGPISCTAPCTSISVSVGGTYSLKVTSNVNGCTAMSTASISANKTAPAAQAAGDLITCSHSTASLSGSGSATGAGITYLWTGAGAVTNSTSISASTTTGGSYTLKVTDSGNGCTSTATASVSTNTASPTFTVCITQPTLCNKGSLTIIPNVVGNYHYTIDGGSHSYNVNATNVTVTSTNATFSNLLTGDVTSVQITNDNTGCSSTPVNCGSLSTYLSSSCGAAGITSRVQQESLVLPTQPTVKAFPNPFNDHVKFMINAPSAGNGSLDIYNVMGQKVKAVYQGRIMAGSNSFEVTIPKKDQETLIYILRVGSEKVTGKLLQLNR